MTNKPRQRENYPTLVIHSTDNSFGFGYRKNNKIESDKLFIKNFNNDLCNNLINDLDKFISKEDLQKVNKISVSIGPANFNASRLIVVLARTISQQINCPLDSFSSFEIIAKRIALKNNIFTNKKSFWIYKKLKRKGFIAGKYEIRQDKKNPNDIFIQETVLPKVIEEINNKELFFEAIYEDKEDLKELLDLSNKSLSKTNLDSWQKVLPLYPISPIN
ncbi:inactive metal-dependent protease [Prochlorococcus marinus str. MIT 9321]|uniref:Inactive metal-dependent protease n=1 Tax=Prochlorococcus marinus str. MIT 9401 TaxID=167551 RepID=A0A0A2B1W3_PROMR|nr:molecular chaperone [Prochlorococcus marinus]KGG04104.1 inactive metal-dependent protease [Prochlorococcus marinus str. MIT 9321]KGG06222.1 inactive metal-dependent protease [Prochlorococcus marinus str. MIT 9322]KGG06795.1 inactive metal-dependent protease [Prochlorococcus marinus str. MIT 9401]